MEPLKDYEIRNTRIVTWGFIFPAFLFMIWSTFLNINDFNEMLDTSNTPNENIVNDFEIGDLTLTKTVIPTAKAEKTVAYVTAKKLTYLASKSEQTKTISTNYGLSMMTGLESYPSFLITEKHNDFWKSQFYFKIIFKNIGFALFFLIGLIFSEINIRQNRKLFTREIKWLFFALLLLVFIAQIVDVLIYGRMIVFLNREFYLGESLIGGFTQEFNWLIGALLFLIIFIEKGIPILEEQELTV